MKSNDKLIKTLNGLLADELTTINQYVVHAEMAENWGYGKLKKSVGARSMTEMKHAEKLIERILFLEGTPIVGELNQIHIGADVPKQYTNDLAAEMTAVANYNHAVKLAADLGDNATREILEGILKDEDGHVNEIEEKLDQIKQMGVQQFLATQVGEKASAKTKIIKPLNL
jgi:bacterioferritin